MRSAPWRLGARSSRRIVLASAITALGLMTTYYNGLWRFNYPSPRRYPVGGIDVSHHQGFIDWYQASLHGVRFAYLKASEGADFRDRWFLYNRLECENFHIPWGPYHYFSFCRSGAGQARNFLQAVPPGRPPLPPALDLEFSDNCGGVPSRAAMRKEVSAFVAAVAQRYPEPPVFYVTHEFYKRYLDGHRADYPRHRLWIRDVANEPSLAPCRDWAFWQYADHGHIPGVRGGVDLNVFCGNDDQFAEMTSGQKGEKPPPPPLELRRR